MIISGCGSDTKPPNATSSDGASSRSAGSQSSANGGAGNSSSAGGESDCEGPYTDRGYCLVWRDEFQTARLDRDKWQYEINCQGGGNNERQCYVDDEQNVWLDGEYLHIKAIREDSVGPALNNDEEGYDPNDTSGSGTYTSGRIRTKGQGDWTYGRFEVRARLPAGQGAWPAAWMLPTDWVYGGWAASGEIDIMEAVNLKVDGEDRVHGTLHFGDNWPNNVYAGEAYRLPGGANPADGFHTYALEWEAGEIRWYVDGDHYATQTAGGWYSNAALDEPHAPFNQRFHIILNLAVGGDWPESVNAGGVDESAFPQAFVVDYVRVYECRRDPDTGRGCATTDDDYTLNPGVMPPEPVDVGGDGELSIFDGAISPPYNWYFYTAADGDSVAFETVNAGGDYGEVGQMTYNTDEGIGFFQSESTADLSAYRAVRFDLRILENPYGAADALTFRADCVYPCSSGDYALAYPGLDRWQHYRVPLDELASRGLDLTAVNTPFVIAPPVGQQDGVVLQVDNLRLER